ncbi:flavin reductase family protein [Acinetobacter sp. ANC 4648]|uniref:flavin reductase family protein n=1 Tax=Acinetobacter sp. ANC 4648 TaxID=1977875 RepID=UPI000A34F7B1|nr:iron-sulfur cluster-binding domain-containing protein [Acinetobacter sp. ANC 4648]OTG83597.1 oxidoreductase [Acinetobacter sp. ANC 4648]
MLTIEKRKSLFSTLAENILDQNAANFWLQKVNPLWSVHQALGKVVQKEHTATHTVCLTLQTNRYFNQGQAGQHHPVTVEYQGRRYERTYSLTALDANHVLLTAKKVEQGIVSQYLTEQAKIGDVLEFGQPYGDMLATDTQPIVLLAAGSGITPMFSLIKALTKTKKKNQQPIQLLYWVKKHTDVAFKPYFKQLAEQNSNFKFQIFYTQEERADSRLNEQHVNLIQNLASHTVYACGPSGFVTKASTLFADAQIFKSEAFSLTPTISDDVGFIQVTLTKSNKSISIPKGQSILVGLEQQNIKPEHGCRMGICNKCVCNKAQGATKNLVNGSENTEPGHPLKICVNTAQTDLVIDL